MMSQFVDIATNATDVCFLKRYQVLQILVDIYFERVDSIKGNVTEFHWQQLTLHLAVVAVKNLIKLDMMPVVELYSDLLHIEKRDNEDVLDLRCVKANVFLFDFVGEINRGLRVNDWKMEFDRLLPLLKLLAMLGCSNALVVTMRCIANREALVRITSLLCTITSTYLLATYRPIFHINIIPNVSSNMSELHCATQTPTTSHAHILDLITHLEQQVNNIFKSSSDTYTEGTRALQVIR